MKFAQLWALVAEKANTGDVKAVERIVRAFARTVVEATTAGDRITLRELGTFRGRRRKGFTAKANGVHHVINSRVVLTFRAARAVRVLRRSP